MKSIGTTRQAAKDFGFVKDNGLANTAAFMEWARAKGIKPEHGKTHHLWWNYRQIENAFDNKPKIKTDSDWKTKISEALSGEDKGGIPCRTSL